ncbi:hypothetical protein V1227_28400 [Lentzea sp. DG1S-22]|uniref:hypothetical protein n=1 Tax=Lentzea sp. DG1S-22 TaxID=3108822 RepID=UPI002E78B496|nr:hypothetical protein [Lentzea sp. DG1S-22]WVH78946.1 hypothetical protein V1227_28400 [Lentzea sp. DG1S-22]
MVLAPPDPVPAGWLDRYGWRINREKVKTLAARTQAETAFLCGCVENEEEVLDLFDLVVCLVIDDETLRQRLLSRTTIAFGKHPEELAASLGHNAQVEPAYRRLGATIIDGCRPLEEVVEAARRLAGGQPPVTRRTDVPGRGA